MAQIERLVSIIGMPRSGTTWLHDRLKRHSRIVTALGRIKEVHYFDAVHAPPNPKRKHGPAYRVERVANFEQRIDHLDTAIVAAPPGRKAALEEERAALRHFIDRFAVDDRWYADIFEPGPDDWCLDSTPSYFRLPPRGLTHLRDIADDTRLILLLRNPYLRAVSGIRHRTRVTGADYDEMSLEDRIDHALRVVNQHRIENHVERLQMLVGARLRTVFFEPMIDDPEPAIRGILADLGLDWEPACLEGDKGSPNPSRPFPLPPEITNLVFDETRWGVESLRAIGLEPPASWDAIPDEVTRPAV